MKFRKVHNKKEKVDIKTTEFVCWNNGKEYTCVISAPSNVETYRLKEIFDKYFSCKKEDITTVSSTVFKQLHDSIEYKLAVTKR